MNNPESIPFLPESFEVEGEPFTKDRRIIAALVKKLGGTVELTADEINSVIGLQEIDSGENILFVATI
jgi:hypothetical protein